MPLLKKKTLEKAQVDEILRDDEEVFHCVMTNEIFSDYDEFAERTILCNSMVWTCSMTGKSNLTYEEALQSEQNAKKMLNDFPLELRIPMLYIANLTKRSGFSDMAEDVYLFIKDHYFVGENLEACLAGNKWKEYQVRQVLPPTEQEVANIKNNAPENEDITHLAALLYKYELEPVSSDEKEKTNEKIVAQFSQMKRKKLYYSKDKSKLFLKQYVEQNGTGILGIKHTALESFGINTMKFDQIFAGAPPVFEVKKLKALTPNGKKVRQETLTKFLSKNNILIPKDEKEKAEHEQRRKVKALKELAREREREKKQLEREKKKQRTIEMGIMLRDWNNPTEDLLLNDHKVLPAATPIKSRIPDKFMGDALSVMEFTNVFASVIETRKYFTHGLSLAIMEKILLNTRAGSQMNEFIQMLLNALFKFQAREKDNYGGKLQSKLLVSDDTLLSDRCQIWCTKNYGKRLFDLPLYTLTLSEILRLHLLSSGENVSENGVRWRTQFRGGYESDEDPAIHFRLHNPHIIKFLALHHVCQLSVADKLKVLNCLVNQLLTFKDIRDVIYDNMDTAKSLKSEIRLSVMNVRKRQIDMESQIAALKRGNIEFKSDEALLKINALRQTEQKIKTEHDEFIADLNPKVYRNVNLLGHDRAFRAYMKLHSLPGLVVNHENPTVVGACLPEITQHVPELIGADREQIIQYLKKVTEDMNSSDKENEPKENGVDSKLATKLATISELLLCSTDPTTCAVHSINQNAPRWCFIQSQESFEQLVQALNKRGMRESDLRSTLENDHASVSKLIGKTPNYVADTSMLMQTQMQTRFNREENLGYAENYATEETLRLAVIESILEIEEKLFTGYLGGIAKDRDTFRKLVADNVYARIDDLTRPRQRFVEDEESDKPIPTTDWEDPGAYLDITRADIDSEDSDIDSDEVLLTQTAIEKQSIKFLAYALVQIAMSVKPHFMLRPMGDVPPKGSSLNRRNVIVLWEQSLLNSTSYSQLLLHYSILDNSINWSKSTLLVKCKACQRGRDDQNILLCDYCNDGYHLYCLRPKLSAVPRGEWYCVTCIPVVEKMKAKQGGEEAEDSDGEPHVCKKCGYLENEDSLLCSICKHVYHIECTNLKRSVRGAWTCTDCKDSAERHEHTHRRSGRNHESHDDMPLNNAALQEMLRDVMKHEDGWPFVRPVPKHEVPDYYDIISKPMDFGKIKYKLNMGNYQYDDEVIADCQLVFENCHTYNSADDEVYKCGTRLAKYFVKKCKELKLDFHVDLSLDIANGDTSDEDEKYEPQRKTRRTK